MKKLLALLLALVLPIFGNAAQFAVNLSTAKGIASILYGTDPHNYVNSGSTIPIFRAGFAGGAKNYQALNHVTVSTTNTTNDTLTLVDANSAIAKVTIIAKPGTDTIEWDFTIQNLNTAQDITTWDLRPWIQSFEAPPGNGVTPWPFTGHGYDLNFGLALQFNDGSTNNPWQIWWSDLIPISMRFAPHGSLYPTMWDVYLNGDTSDPAVYCAVPIKAGQAITFNLKSNYYSAQQNVAAAVPGAFSIQAVRLPEIMNQSLFGGGRHLMGMNFMAQSPPSGSANPVQNPNGWQQANPAFNLYDPAGSGQLVANMTGDESGLRALAKYIIGRIQWCNYITYVRCGGVSVIHWDLFDGEPYPQPGTDYIGNPPGSTIQCPELWYRSATFPVSIIQQALDNIKLAYNPANPSQPTFCPGLIPGATLRADLWPYPPRYANPAPTQRPYPDLATAVNDLINKIRPLYFAGFRYFYIDSFGPSPLPGGGTTNPLSYTVDLLRQVQAQFPDVQLIPEAYGRVDVYSTSCPFRDRFPSIDSDPQAHLIWPTAHCTMRMENGGNISMNPASALYPNGVQVLQDAWTGHDDVMANCFSGSPTELEQVKAIQQSGLIH